MNNHDHNKEASRQYKFEVGRTITYGLPIFVSVHILGLFIAPLDWIWHFPPLLSLLASIALGFILHWLVFTFTPKSEKRQA